MFRRKHVLTLEPHQKGAIDVVAHGMLSLPNIAGGQAVAAIVIDSRARPDLVEHVKLHEGSEAFDVRTVWAEIPGEGRICLVLEFEGPTLAKAIIRFVKSGHLKSVDRIVRKRILYLMCGGPGDRVSTAFGVRPSMILEINAEWPMTSWERLLHKSLVAEARSSGMNRGEARAAVRHEVAAWRRQDTLLRQRPSDA
jgi:hypothetical protein